MGLTASIASAQVPAAVGGAWRFLGPAPIQDSLDQIGAVGGEVTAVALGPSGQIYVAAAWGGVWESGDGGTTWSQISDTASAQFGPFTVNALAVAPDGTLYAGTGSLSQPGLGAVGLLVTRDGGATWSMLGPFTGGTITTVDAGLTVSGATALAVTVAGPVRAGIWWTNDNGGTWTAPLQEPASGYARLGDNIWASFLSTSGWVVNYWSNGLNGSFLSTPLLWPSGTTPAAVELAASSHEAVALGLASNGACMAIETSPGADGDWQPLAAVNGGCPPGDSSPGPAAIAFDAQGDLRVGGAGLWEWPAAGGGWQPATGVAGAVGALMPAPLLAGSTTNLYAGSEDGLWRQSCDTGCDWQNITGNLAAVRVDSVAVTAAGAVWIGAQQGGVAGQPSWATALPLSDGAQVAAPSEDANNAALIYAALPNASGIEVSSDGGALFSQALFGGGGPSAAAAPLLAVNPADGQQVYYAAGEQLWQSGDGAVSWSPDGSPAAAVITALAVAASTGGAPPEVVAGDAAGQASVNGAAWMPLPVSSAVTAVASAGASVFAAAGGELLVSANGGGNWQAVSGLPTGTVSALASDPADALAVYAGLATGGVYASADGGESWSRLGTGLPNAPVAALVVEMQTRQLIAATAGRGVWALALGQAAANVTLSGAASGTVGSTISLTATVANVIGQPAGGATVNWAVNGGAPAAASVADAQGQAVYTLTLPAAAGTETVTAWVTGSAQGEGSLTVTAQAGTASSLAAAAGGGQSGVAGQALANPLVAEVSDSSGNPVAGVTVTFSDGGAGGSFTPASGQAVSGGDGRASIVYTLPAKPQAVTITAEAPNLPPVAFPETAAPPPSFTLSLTPPTLTADVATTAALTLASTAVNGDAKTITLRCTEPVTGCNVTPGTISPGASAAITVATGSLAVGNNTVTVSGGDGVTTTQATATVVVPPPDFTLTLAPSQPAANQDSPFTLTAAAQPVNGAYAQIALSCPQPSSGCTVSPAAIAPGQSATVTIAAGTLAPGPAQVTVQGVDSTDQETHLAAAAITVVAAGMAVAAAPAALALSPGGSGQVAVTATPVGGLSGLVVLSCSGLPADAACSFSPASLTSAGGAVASTLVISTTANSALPPVWHRALPFGPWGLGILLIGLALLAALAVAPALREPGGSPRRARWAAVGLLVLALLAGCGGGAAPADPPPQSRSGTPLGSYTVQLTATSGKVIAQTSITLQVN